MLLAFYAVFGVIAIGALILVILPKFIELERKNGRENMQGCVDELEGEGDALLTVLGTWRQWEDLYQFAEDQNATFRDANLTPGELASADCAMIIILDRAHEQIVTILPEAPHADRINLEHARDAVIPLTRKLWDHPSPDNEMAGLMGTEGVPLIVAAGMLTNSAGDGEPRGVVIMARFLTEVEIERVGNQLSIPLKAEMYPYDASRPDSPDEPVIHVEELNSRELRLSAELAGMRKKPIIRLSAIVPREIRAYAVETIWSVSLIYLSGGTIASIVFFMALNGLVLRRLTRLNTEMNRVSFTGQSSANVTAEGKDEIAHTAATVNQMIERMNESSALVRKNEEQFRIVTTLAPVGIFVTDVDGQGTFVNQQWCELTGLTAEQAIGEGWTQALYPEDREKVAQQWKASVQKLGKFQMEFRFVRPDGSVIWVKGLASAILDENGIATGFLGTVHDVTSTKQRQMELEQQALYDPVTTLANRVLFHDRMEHAFASSRRRPPHPFTVFFMDLDGFKAVNDSHGHEAGDKVLHEVARRMSLAIRPGDTLARIGGDEFAVILRDAAEVRHGHAVADRLIASVNEPITLGAASVTVGISIGAALDHKGYESANDLINAADKAMYRAKLGGKNRVIFANPPMGAAAPPSGS